MTAAMNHFGRSLKEAFEQMRELHKALEESQRGGANG